MNVSVNLKAILHLESLLAGTSKTTANNNNNKVLGAVPLFNSSPHTHPDSRVHLTDGLTFVQKNNVLQRFRLLLLAPKESVWLTSGAPLPL